MRNIKSKSKLDNAIINKENSLPKKGTEKKVNDVNVPVVGIGASAGGLEAFEVFFKTMPTESGMAFVLISHLDPNHTSMLSEILQRSTTMLVSDVKDGVKIEGNNVYILPPAKDMTISHGMLHLSDAVHVRGMRLPIDTFFQSLAEDQAEQAICVILSGSGSDGTLGIKAIHDAGGVSFVQEPSTAKYDGMPTSAIQSNVATYVLPIEKITEQLVTYAKGITSTGILPVVTAPTIISAMKSIMIFLQSKTGNDFSLYKQTMIQRRIERRMTTLNFKDLNAYTLYLRGNSAEVQLLFQDLLINVTNFFRDKEAYQVFSTNILPKLFENKPDNYIFRIWVPGCASGEEAYSLAIIFCEYMEENNRVFKLKIYATDIDTNSITTARTGLYSENIAKDVSPNRLRLFFSKEETGFRIKKEIREMVTFAIQNVIKDPPFTKVDLISCRNLLIYLDPKAQDLIITKFHYALKPGGVLFLSPAEGIGNTELFSTLDKKWKIFKVNPSLASTRNFVAQHFPLTDDHSKERVTELLDTKEKPNFAEITKRVLLQSFAPPSVITYENGNIVYVHGDTGKYLQPARGQMSTNIIDMAREGLQKELRYAILNTVSKKHLYIIKNLQVKTNGDIHGINLTVRSIPSSGETPELLLISFQDVELPLKKKDKPAKLVTVEEKSKRMEELEEELAYTKENLQDTIEEMQAVNEELQSTSEEMQSTNEETQSTNEELMTSKEELQSVNEEMDTVNSELLAKIDQLTNVQNDMKNLFENVNVGAIFLDEHLRIKRFTRDAIKVYRLAASDIGRPLEDIRSLIQGMDLISDSKAVIESLIPREKQVITEDKERYMVRIVPYRTLENVIEGVVLTFDNITALKKLEEVGLARARDAQGIIDTVREPLVVLNSSFEVISASRSFYTAFEVTPEMTEGKVLYELGNNQWEIPRLHELLEKVLPDKTSFEDFEVEHDFPGIGHRVMLLNARRITDEADTTQLILLAMEEVPNRKRAKKTPPKKGETARLARNPNP